MKQAVYFILKIIAVWLLFFTFQRALFAVHYWSDFDVSFIDLIKLPYFALKLDFAAIGYISILVFVFISLGLLNFSRPYSRVISIITKSYLWFIGIASSLIFASELVSYAEWREKLNSKIFVHFETPSEIFRTSSGTYTWWFLLYFTIQIVLLYFLFKWLFKEKQVKYEKKSIGVRIFQFFVTFIITSFIGVLAMRGGPQKIPVSATNAYFTNSQITNDLSVNSVWNFIHMSFDYFNSDLGQFYSNLSEDEAKILVQNLYDFPDSDSIRIINSQEPNIIFVTLEGWSAQLIGCLDGEPGITPNFDKLANEGVLFSQIYATSETSETGHTSIFSGYPTLPKVSMSSESSKCRKMPSIIKALHEIGYSSSYYFGGDLSYGNIGGYLTEIGFDKLTDENELQHLEPKGDLGIHDEAMFSYFFNEIEKAKRPYVYGLFTQSTHSPYDMPAPMLDAYPESKYASSMHYADEQIKVFTNQLKQLPDFENTIVVFVSDHGKTNFVNNYKFSDQFFHIPVLFWGGAIKNDYKGHIIDKIGSQIDVSKTLLNQLNHNTSQFNWSKDLLNPFVNEWAILTTSDTYCMKTKDGYVTYHIKEDNINDTNFSDTLKAKKEVKNTQAVIESVYREFQSF
jgi:phosphoglycerol transferase MdoB-like AlkP superfamily enzyme